MDSLEHTQVGITGSPYDPETAHERADIVAHKEMMASALKDAGRWLYGVKAIEVWLYTSDASLERSEHSSWVDPVYFFNDDPTINKSLKMLYDRNSKHYAALERLAPGEGLSGILWEETFGKVGKIEWRDVQGLANDPDKPYNPRLPIIASAGFRSAAGIQFSIQNTRGIVIFLAREVDLILTAKLNQDFMMASAYHIGSVLSLFNTRCSLSNERSKRVRTAFLKIKNMLKMAKAISSRPQSDLKASYEARVEEEEKTRKKRTLFSDKFKERTKMRAMQAKKYYIQWSKKMLGAGILPPPSTSYRGSAFILFAAFLTCYIMMMINTVITNKLGREMSFETSQIASLTTMVYALTASPAAQPGSILLGRTLSMFVGMTFALIPIGATDEDEFHTPLGWFRYSGAVAAATSLMAKAGVPHPPGGSLSVLFLQYQWEEIITYQKIGILILQDSIFVLIASILNNLNSSKAYPTYWGHLPHMISEYFRDVIWSDPDEA